MFSGRVFRFCSGRVSRVFLSLLAFSFFMCNRTVFGGIYITDDTTTTINYNAGTVNFTTGGNTGTVNFTSGVAVGIPNTDTTALGGVITIVDSAATLTINVNGGDVVGGTFSGGANGTSPLDQLITTDLDADFYGDTAPADGGFGAGEGISILNNSDNNTIINHNTAGLGGIEGHIVLFGGDNQINLVQDGDIHGDVHTGDGDDTIFQSSLGWIHSNVNLRGGNNSVTLTEGAFIGGTVTFGDGDDTLSLSSATGQTRTFVGGLVSLGDGTNTVIINNESDLLNGLTGGAGVDTITLNGDATIDIENAGVSLLGGNDVLILNDTAEITDAGGLGAFEVNLGTGNDELYLNSGTTISGTVNLDAGDDLAEITDATISGDLELGSGNNTVTLDGSTLTGTLSDGGNSGNDTVDVINGSDIQGDIDLGDGDNILTVTDSMVDGNISMNGSAGDNQTLILNSSTFDGDLSFSTDTGATGFIQLNNSDVTLGADLDLSASTGSNTLEINSGSTLNADGNDILFGTGNDTLRLQNGGNITNGDDIDLSDGDDNIEILGSSTLTIAGTLDVGNGTNTFTLGGSGTKITAGAIDTSGSSTNALSFISLNDGNTNLALFDLTDFNSFSVSGGGAITGAAFTFGDGTQAQTFSLSNGADFQRSISLSGTSSTITIDDSDFTGASIDGTAGVDVFSATDSNITTDLDLGTGDDDFTLDGTTFTGNVELGAGTNTVVITDSSISGTLDSTGGGVDTVGITDSTLTGDVTLGGAGITFNSTDGIFGGALDLSAITGVNAISLTNSSVAGGLTLGGGTDTLTLNNSTITGGIDAGAGTDTLGLAGTGTLSGAVTNFEGLEVNGTEWTLNSALTLGGASDVNLNTGILNVNGVLTSGGAVNIDAGTTLNLGSDITATGNVNINGSLIGSGDVTGAATVGATGTVRANSTATALDFNSGLTLSSGSTLEFVESGGVSSVINVTGTLDDTAGGIDTTFTPSSLLNNGDQFTLLTDDGGGDLTVASYNLPASSFVLDYDFASSTATDLILNVTRTPYDSLTSPTAVALRPMLTQLEAVRLVTTSSTEFAQLESLNQQAFDQALLQINPSALANGTNIAQRNAQVLEKSVVRRLDQLQSSLAGEPMFTGPEGPGSNPEYGYRMWTDINYKFGEQDSDDLALGYDFSNYNFTIGVDAEFTEWLIGAAGSYSNSSIDYDESGGDSDVDSLSLGIFAKYIDRAFFWDNYLTLSFSDISTDREVLSSSIDSDSDAMVYRIGSQVGYKFEADGYFFTPIAGLSIGQTHVDGVSESGSVFAVTTDDETYTSLKHKIGIRTGFYNVMEGEDYYTVEFKAFWHREYLDTDRDLTARFVGGGTDFDVDGIEADSDIFELGVGIRFDYGEHQLKLDYDFEFSGEYSGHTLSLNWLWVF